MSDSEDNVEQAETNEGTSDATAQSSNNNTKNVKLDSNATVVASHYNKLEETGMAARKKSRIFYLRNYNNWIKSMIMQKYFNLVQEHHKHGAPLRVLDMCCGKGGDLGKWKIYNVTHLICADIAEVSVEQCRNRAATNQRYLSPGQKPIKMEFIVADCTLEQLRKKYQDPSIDLHMVSCQFAFHYCFESLKQAEMMLRNAAECLKEGCYFIGTMPDANEIMKRQRQAGEDTFGNDIYKVTFMCDTERPPLFGAKYYFKLDDLVDCPEFLVHVPTLERLALKYGLRLVETRRFDELYDDLISAGQGLAEKVQAFTPYPIQERSNIEYGLRNPDEYSHAEQYMKQRNHSPQHKVGTLSKSEWEVATLYLFFAFRKMKTSWDANGKPQYS